MQHSGVLPISSDPLPPRFLSRLAGFADLFTPPTWSNVLVLLAGVILAPGRRTVPTAPNKAQGAVVARASSGVGSVLPRHRREASRAGGKAVVEDGTMHHIGGVSRRGLSAPSPFPSTLMPANLTTLEHIPGSSAI